MKQKRILYLLFYIFNVVLFRLLFSINDNLSLLWIILGIVVYFFQNNKNKKYLLNNIAFSAVIGGIIFYVNYKIINMSFLYVFIINILLFILSLYLMFNVGYNYKNKINKYVQKNNIKIIIFLILFILIII